MEMKEKVDVDVMRADNGQGKRVVAFNMHIDGRKLFTEYGLDYIRRTARICMAKSAVQDGNPEKMEDEIIQNVGMTLLKAAAGLAREEIERIVNKGKDEFEAVIKEFLEGGDNE